MTNTPLQNPASKQHPLSSQFLGRSIVGLYALYFFSDLFISKHTMLSLVPYGLISFSSFFVAVVVLWYLKARKPSSHWPLYVIAAAALVEACITAVHVVLSWQAGWHGQSARGLLLVMLWLLIALAAHWRYLIVWLQSKPKPAAKSAPGAD